MQMNLFDLPMLQSIARDGSTSAIYRDLAREFGLPREELDRKVQAGAWGMTSYWKRKFRFIQQDLKAAGLIERAERRGQWRVTRKGKFCLNEVPPNAMKVAFVTDKGMALFGDAKDLAKLFPAEVECIITSPPYFLTQPREYGDLGRAESEYVNELVSFCESFLPALTATGSIVLNLGESYLAGTHGQMSLATERLLIALNDKLGLKLMQRFVWNNPSKPPVGYNVTHSKNRLTTKTEHLLWLSMDPSSTKADSSRVLQPYEAGHHEAIQRQARRAQDNPQCGRKLRPSGVSACNRTFNADRGGAIPGNILKFSHEAANSPYSNAVKEAGLPRHPAMMPVELIRFLAQFITEEGDLLADPFLGSCTLGAACEPINRRWAGTERIREYLLGGKLRMQATGSNFLFSDGLSLAA
jgi:DNA modification methylase